MHFLLSLVDRIYTHTFWWMSSFAWASSKSNHLAHSSRLICKSANWIFDWPSQCTRCQLVFVDDVVVVDFSLIDCLYERHSSATQQNERVFLAMRLLASSDHGKGGHYNNGSPALWRPSTLDARVMLRIRGKWQNELLLQITIIVQTM